MTTRLIGAAALACLAALPVSAQGYFEGKTVTYIIATDPGGGYDAYGRLIGKYLEGKLGARRVVYKNLPGAGHIIGANTLYASEPDGLTIGTFNTGLIYAQILQREGVQFDLTQFEWIGKASADPRVLVLAKTSGLETFEDLAGSSDPVRFASTGVGSASYTETKMLADALDLSVELIPGYQGNDGEMAMLRGEIAGQVGSLSSLQPFIDTGDATVALAVGGAVEPQAMTVAETDKARSIVSLIDALSNLGRLSAAPPGVPDEVVEELRDAYMAVMEDPDFLADAEKLGLPIDAARGDKVEELVLAALKQSPETVEIIAAANEVEIPTVKVTSDIVALEDGNKLVTFTADGTETKGEISGSRTAVMLDGAEAKRDNLAVGMSCELEYDPSGAPIEFVAVSCTQ